MITDCDTIPDIKHQDTILLMRVCLSSPTAGWLALIGRNLGDEYIQTSGSDAPSTGGGAGTEAGFAGDNMLILSQEEQSH